LPAGRPVPRTGADGTDFTYNQVMKRPALAAGTATGNGEHLSAPAPPPPAAEAPLLLHIDRLMEQLHAQVSKALDAGEVEGIHQARVATRRLKAALDLAEPVVGKKRRKPLARVLRKLRRRLGPLRDTDVMLEHLQELAAKHEPAARWLADHLSSRREALRGESEKKGSSADVLAALGAWYPVREQIRAGADALPGLLVESLHLQLDAFVEQADRLTAGVAAQDPHQLRIAGKALRYTLEMAVAQGHDLHGSVLKTFKRMQETLGAWHDFVVLTDQAMRSSLDELLGHHDPALQEKVLDLARVTLRRSARELEQFGGLWTAKGADLTASIRTTFPLSPPAAVTEPKTDPGPGDSAAPEAPAAAPPVDPSAAS
jgi:CHAD domain-containing protein